MIPRPETLGVELKLHTLADVDAALHELGWCQQQKAEVDARTQAAVDRLKAETQPKLMVKIDGGEVTIADRTAALEAALVTWCGAKLAGHLAETGKQSLTLAHGVRAKAQQAAQRRPRGSDSRGRRLFFGAGSHADKFRSAGLPAERLRQSSLNFLPPLEPEASAAGAFSAILPRLHHPPSSAAKQDSGR